MKKVEPSKKSSYRLLLFVSLLVLLLAVNSIWWLHLNDTDSLHHHYESSTLFQSLDNFGQKRQQSESKFAVMSNTQHNNTNAVMELWHRYKREHSLEALESEWAQKAKTDRRFSIAYYSCPLQAGNRFHHFINSLIWSIVTNRTMLYHYFDKESCKRLGLKDKNICTSLNTIQDCNEILTIHSDMPSFTEWSEKLSLGTITQLSFWSTVGRLPDHIKWKSTNTKYFGLADTSEDIVIDFAPMLQQQAKVLANQTERNMLLQTAKARKRAQILLERGPNYLYGLLLQECFHFQPVIQQIVEKQQKSPESIIIVLHSRHIKPGQDGSDISKEKDCLNHVLSNDKTEQSCQVALLSDRPKTLNRVRNFLEVSHPHCTTFIANHDRGKSWKSEHGPFAGAGFFQDLALVDTLVSQAHPDSKFAFIGGDRSSSLLIQEHMVYTRSKQQEHQQIYYTSSPELINCFIGPSYKE